MTALQQHRLYELAHELDRLGDYVPLVPPQVNINGTSAEDLVDQQRSVLSLIDLLMEAMAKASPHGRDWQFEGGEHLFGICRKAWLQRRAMLEVLRKEIETYAISILEQPAVARKRLSVPLTSGDQFKFETPVTPLDEEELSRAIDEELKQTEKSDG